MSALLFGLAPRLSAASGTISVSPAYSKVSLSSVQPTTDETVVVTNNFEHEIRLNVGLTGVDKSSGKPDASLTADAVIARTVSISETDLRLAPHKSRNIKLRFTNNDQLTPGGHYGAVLIRQIDQQRGGVGLVPAVSVGLYVIKEDGAKRQLQVATQSLSKIMFRLPANVSVTSKNTGNVVVIPKASLSIGRKSQAYELGILNEASRALSPGDQQATNVAFKSVKQAWIPGKYSLTTTYRYQGSDDTSKSSQDFWYLPWQYIIVSVLIFSLCFWQRRRLYKIPTKIHGKALIKRKKITQKSDK